MIKKKAKVLLVAPNMVGMSDGLNRIQPSLGLMLIASCLLDDGHDVKIHDTGLAGWNNRRVIDPIKDPKKVEIGQSDADIKKYISEYSPDIIGISVLFSNFLDSAHTVARIAKEINPKIKVILGGNHISNSVIDYGYSKDLDSNLPDCITDLEDENMDLAMIGEGELAFVDLTNALINNEDINDIAGLVKKIGPKKYIINKKHRTTDLAELPRPARHLVDMEGYFKIGAFQGGKPKSPRVLSIMCSRGCPEKCTFCTTPQMWGSNIRWRPVEKIMEEINEDVKKYNIGEIQFLDDTLTLDKNHLFEMCDELEKLGVPWCTPNGTKVNYHLKEQAHMYQRMYDSGCYQITLAVESGSQRVLDTLINKRLPLETVYPAIERAKKAGMLVHTFYIVGYPGETIEDMERTVDFAMNSGADSYSFAVLQPLPGTPIYRQVVREKLWWPGRGLDDMMKRSSLIKVNGFNSSDEVEKWADNLNIEANLMLHKNNPARFKEKYNHHVGDKYLKLQS